MAYQRHPGQPPVLTADEGLSTVPSLETCALGEREGWGWLLRAR